MPIVSRPHRRIAPRVYRYTDDEGGLFLRIRWIDDRIGKVRERAINCPPGATRAAAEVMLQGITERIAEGTWRPDSVTVRDRPPTLRDVVDEFIQSREWRPSTRATFDSRRKLWADDLEDALVRDIDLRLHVRPWWDAVARRYPSPSTQRNILASLRAVFHFAVASGYAPRDPTALLRPATAEPREVVLVEVDQLAPAFDHWLAVDMAGADAGRYIGLWSLYALVLYAGLRISEARCCRWQWLDFRTGTMHLPARATKSNRARAIPLSRFILDALIEHRGRIGAHGTEAQRAHLRSPDGLVWSRGIGTVLTTAELSGMYWRPAMEAAGLESGRGAMHPHKLRYLAVNRMTDAGIPIVAVNRIVGHSSMAMHLRYRAPTEASLESARKTMAELPPAGEGTEQVTPSGGELEDFTPPERPPRRRGSR